MPIEYRINTIVYFSKSGTSYRKIIRILDNFCNVKFWNNLPLGPWLYTIYSISIDCFLSCSKTVFNQIHSMIYPISFSVLSAIFLSHFKKLLHLKSDTIKTLPTFPQSSEILQDEIISSQSIASCSIYHHVFKLLLFRCFLQLIMWYYSQPLLVAVILVLCVISNTIKKYHFHV